MKINVTIGLSDDLKSFLSKVFNVVEDQSGDKQYKAVLKSIPAAEKEAEEDAPAEKPTRKPRKIVAPVEEAKEPEAEKEEVKPEVKVDLLGGGETVKAKKATTKDDVVKKLQPLIDGEKTGFARVNAALKKFGVDSLVKLDPSKYDDLLKEVLGED